MPVETHQESYVPGGFGTPNYWVATDDDGHRVTGSSEQEVIEKIEDLQEEDD